MMKYIAQRGPNDCGFATLAMAVGVDYERIAKDLTPDMGDRGINDLHLKQWLIENGWAWQEVFLNYPRAGKYVQREPWPPRPFAPTHIVLLEATRDWHFVAMNSDGEVFDPWKQERKSLAHPDYKRISWVMGLWHIA